MYKDTIISNPRAKHAPSGFNPTWTAFTGNLTTQTLKDKASDASPSGIPNTCLPTPYNDYLDYKIFNEASTKITSPRKKKHFSCTKRYINEIITGICYLTMRLLSPQHIQV
jgi:hypothetical protein